MLQAPSGACSLCGGRRQKVRKMSPAACRRGHEVDPTTPALARCARPRPASNGGPCKGSQARAWPPQRSAAAGHSLRQQSEARKGTLCWVEHRETTTQSAAGGSRGREGH